MNRVVLSLLVLASSLLMAAPCLAQELAIDAPLTLVINSPTREDYFAGEKEKTDPFFVQWSSPDDWTITVHTEDNDLGPLDNSWSKQIGDLRFMGPDNANYVALTNDPQQVAHGAAGQDEFPIYWLVKLRWGYDRPGQYGATVILTISTNS